MMRWLLVEAAPSAAQFDPESAPPVSTVEVSAGQAGGEGGLGSSAGGASLRDAAPGAFGDAAGSHAR